MKQFFPLSEAEETALDGNARRAVLARGAEIMIVEVSFGKGGVGAAHTHPHAQATYCMEGAFDFTIGDETRRIERGDSVYIPPNATHGVRLVSESGRLLDTFAPQREDFL